MGFRVGGRACVDIAEDVAEERRHWREEHPCEDAVPKHLSRRDVEQPQPQDVDGHGGKDEEDHAEDPARTVERILRRAEQDPGDRMVFAHQRLR